MFLHIVGRGYYICMNVSEFHSGSCGRTEYHFDPTHTVCVLRDLLQFLACKVNFYRKTMHTVHGKSSDCLNNNYNNHDVF